MHDAGFDHLPTLPSVCKHPSERGVTAVAPSSVSRSIAHAFWYIVAWLSSHVCHLAGARSHVEIGGRSTRLVHLCQPSGEIDGQGCSINGEKSRQVEICGRVAKDVETKAE